MAIYSAELLGVISTWQEYLKIQRGYSQHTLDSYLNDLNHFLKFFAKYKSQDIHLKDLELVDIRSLRSWLAARCQGNHNAASNARALSSIKNFYRYLEKKHDISCHAIFIVRSPKKERALPKALSEEETEISLDKIEMIGDKAWVHIRNKALLTLIYASGLRISEALSITPKHLQNNEFLKILGKRNKERIIPWIPESKLLLEQYFAMLPYNIQSDESIFRGVRGGPLQRAVFNKELIEMRRMLGLPEHLSSHAFRHSFATHLLENGASIRSIQELLGHASLSSTQRYTKINKTYLESVYDKASKKF